MSTFEKYQAGVRASDRMHCEADLYWRTNRWARDGRSATVIEAFNRALAGELIEKSYSSYFNSNKSNPPEVGSIFRR